MVQELRIGRVYIGGANPPAILGVVNISPESFYSDSFCRCDRVSERVEQLAGDGADIIDIGARSTALHAPPLSPGEERMRITAALKELDGCGVPLSLDTCHPEVLNAALHYDIALINDIGGLTNPEFAKTVAESGLPVIAMASFRRPGDAATLSATHAAAEEMLVRAESAGIDRLILDPGIGKWTDERDGEADWELVRRFSGFMRYNRPLLAAVSRKQFIGDCLGKPAEDRMAGSLAVLYHLIESGASLLRVHDVAETRDMVSVISRLHNG